MRGRPHSALLPLSALGGILIANLAFGQGVSGVISSEQQRIQQAQQAQSQIDTIAETTRSRFDEYQILLREIEGLEVYNGLLQAQIDDQERQLADLRNSIDSVTLIERQILPLMVRMIDGLETFISLDVPFLVRERMARVENLRNLLRRSDVTTAEQFRNVMQAWQIENDYGRFPETYTGQLQIGGANREVDFLKLGRVALLYVTPDDAIAGAWDHRSRNWVALTRADADAIRSGIAIIEGRTTPEMFEIPVAPPQEN
jgi:hypothetical protein